MKSKLESDAKFSDLQEEYNINGLLDLIKDLVYSTDDSQEPLWVMVNSMIKMHLVRQGPYEPKDIYYKRLVSQVEVTESVWGPMIPSSMKGKATEMQEKAQDAYLARLFLRGLNKNYLEDMKDLGKDYINGHNNYPKDMESAMAWVTNREEAAASLPKPKNNNGNSSHHSNTSNNSNTSNDNDGTRNARSFQQTTTNDSTTHDDGSRGTTSFSGNQTAVNTSRRRRPVVGWHGFTEDDTP